MNISFEKTGPFSLPVNSNRSYFFIVCKTGSIELEFGKGGGRIPLNEGNHYNPPVCPTHEIDITGTGTYVIHLQE